MPRDLPGQRECLPSGKGGGTAPTRVPLMGQPLLPSQGSMWRPPHMVQRAGSKTRGQC